MLSGIFNSFSSSSKQPQEPEIDLGPVQKSPLLIKPSPETLNIPDSYPFHELTPEQLDLVKALREKVDLLLTKEEKDALQHQREKKWADDLCLLRYLKGTKFDLNHSVDRIQKTLEWRREYKPEEITPEEVAPECESGKSFFSGFAKNGSPVLYLVPARENTKTYDRQIRFVVFNLERGKKLMAQGVSKFLIIVDYEGMNPASATPPSVSIKFLRIVGDHYPEHLDSSFMVNPSWYLSLFFKIIMPFVDPVTRSKIHFVSIPRKNGKVILDKSHAKEEKGDKAAEHQQDLGGWTTLDKFVDDDQLLTQFGGTYHFEWDFEAYWSEYLKRTEADV